MANATPVTKRKATTGPDLSELEAQKDAGKVARKPKTVDKSVTTLADGETVRKDN